jgi:hypothetical protein
MAFTEQGVAMHFSVLRSRRTVQVNIEIMQAFVRLCELLAADAKLAARATGRRGTRRAKSSCDVSYTGASPAWLV